MSCNEESAVVRVVEVVSGEWEVDGVSTPGEGVRGRIAVVESDLGNGGGC